MAFLQFWSLLGALYEKFLKFFLFDFLNFGYTRWVAIIIFMVINLKLLFLQ